MNCDPNSTLGLVLFTEAVLILAAVLLAYLRREDR